jgi:hypothetical protein
MAWWATCPRSCSEDSLCADNGRAARRGFLGRPVVPLSTALGDTPHPNEIEETETSRDCRQPTVTVRRQIHERLKSRHVQKPNDKVPRHQFRGQLRSSAWSLPTPSSVHGCGEDNAQGVAGSPTTRTPSNSAPLRGPEQPRQRVARGTCAISAPPMSRRIESCSPSEGLTE